MQLLQDYPVVSLTCSQMFTCGTFRTASQVRVSSGNTRLRLRVPAAIRILEFETPAGEHNNAFASSRAKIIILQAYWLHRANWHSIETQISLNAKMNKQLLDGPMSYVCLRLQQHAHSRTLLIAPEKVDIDVGQAVKIRVTTWHQASVTWRYTFDRRGRTGEVGIANSLSDPRVVGSNHDHTS